MCTQEMAEHEDIMNSAVYNFQGYNSFDEKMESSHEESDHNKPVKSPEWPTKLPIAKAHEISDTSDM